MTPTAKFRWLCKIGMHWSGKPYVTMFKGFDDSAERPYGVSRCIRCAKVTWLQALPRRFAEFAVKHGEWRDIPIKEQA